ncbi:23S rRNA (guanosine(2251)-2'-O)-methyltransferase RlmB [Lapillicoccus jejuensis]|uniref:23S rRNA (Guanosine2251-2'-O)-methyltransferase n=1 Tax=Lapillicoccus jejuensis TaxID=402171 RepID=A0A542E0M2_9MICO|nr:23S rRNA (guanosine(2251)-2'-O)-methyltransferase RlmB [Lapillicoccus jejuensis]TQJ08882.1 23S rRNA (guanosine2251-2'-O)-methyltransferase [Lapillicoccus jejuensis]
MPGNSQRRGAIRKNAKGATVGSGGQRRRGLEGKGPTPKAVDREYHPAAKRARKAAGPGRAGARSGGPARGAARKGKASSEVVAGRNSVVEALRAGVPVTTMYVASRIDADDRVREALKAAGERGLPILETPRGELDRITDGAVHQGLALQVPPYDYAEVADLLDPQAPGIPLVVALDGVTDPRNLGAVVRSVAAFGGHGVLVPERRSAGMTASAWKTSAGAAARIPVARATNLTRALQELQKAGFFVLGLDMEGDVDLPGLALATEPVVVVVGSEGKGLSRLVAETCDQIVSIPMSSAVESLNAGVAAGVTLYEIARQRAATGR